MQHNNIIRVSIKMEKLWYTLSQNVLKEMIEFAPTSKNNHCPTFILKIETVTSSMDRYLLNLIDGTKTSIFCITSAGYSKTFPINEVRVGKMIRLLHYWIFQIESDDTKKNIYEHKYVIMISNAEIMNLTPAKSIASLTRASAKTPRIRGIVNSCFGVSSTSDGGLFQRFCLSDDTGTIGCVVSGTLCDSLDSVLKEGVKLEVSHAMVRKVDPVYKMWNNDFELKLNQFSTINIYNTDDLSLIYSSRAADKKVTSGNCEIDKFGRPSTTSKLSNESNGCQEKCSNGKIPIPMATIKQSGMCPAWIRGTVESQSRISKSRVNSDFMRLHLRDHSTVICCTVWDPICTPLNAVLKEGMVVEIVDANVKPTVEQYKVSDHDFEIFLTKYSTINVLTPDGTLLYQYIKLQSAESSFQTNSDKPLIELKQKYINGKLPQNISLLTQAGYGIAWIRGIIEKYVSICTTRTNRVYMRFCIRDNTSIIHCTVWEPICISLNRIVKEGMILEINDYKVTPVRNCRKSCNHPYEIYLNEFSSVRVFPDDNTSVPIYEYLQ